MVLSILRLAKKLALLSPTSGAFRHESILCDPDEVLMKDTEVSMKALALFL